MPSQQARLLRVLGALALTGACGLVCVGCSQLKASGGGAAAPTAQNVYSTSDRLPSHLRRVAVLPLAADPSDPLSADGQRTLEPVLRTELAKAKAFELIFVKPEQLKRWTGQEFWTADESLPVDLLQRLEQELGCHAVLFSRLTHYRPYKPILIGWDLKLVDCPEAHIRWSVDEVFDAAIPSVAGAAQRYAGACSARPFWHGASDDSDAILLSPRYFGRYSASVVLAALPQR